MLWWIESSQKFIIPEAEPVFGVGFTIVFRQVSTEETKREEFQTINREAQKGRVVTERIFSAR